MNISSVKGAEAPPLSELTIGEALDRAARRWPEQEALISVEQGIRWTYAEFSQRVDLVASSLLQHGLCPGDCVAIWSPNCAEWAIVQFATAKAGLILVNINPAYQASELAFTLNKVRARALVTADSFRAASYIAILEQLAPEVFAGKPFTSDGRRLPHLRLIFQIGPGAVGAIIPFDTLYITPEAIKLSKLDNHQAINIQFTSGTTGLPKGAVLTHRNILNNGYFVGCSMGLRARDRLCIPVPLYHCFGMVMGNLACITHGATMIYPCAGFDALAVLKTVQAERCTGLLGVPTMFMAILEHASFPDFDLSSLRGGIMAGAPCPAATMQSVVDRMHMQEVTIAYGMTETSPVSFQSSVNDLIDVRIGTVGRIQPHLEVKLIDEVGDVVRVGEPGELCTRGYSSMLGYWDDEGATSEVIDSSGWLHTGDLATLDDRGYCKIVGRLKDVVIRGGENIYPREIEEFLIGHPKIEEVYVIGVPDTRYGEEVCAWIRLVSNQVATADEIVAYCSGNIARYKIPRYIRFVKEFPLTATGKVRKVEMRSMMELDLGDQNFYT